MVFTYKSVSNLLTKKECDLILNFSLKNLKFYLIINLKFLKPTDLKSSRKKRGSVS